MSATTNHRKRAPRGATRKSNEPRRDIYQEVTSRVLTSLEKGTVPWRRPWRLKQNAIDYRFAHFNLKSKKPYRGVNTILLDMAAMDAGYQEPYWVTFKQAIDLGGSVRKGEKSTLVVFWKQIVIDVEEDGQKRRKPIPLLRHYNVFNVEQCDGLEGKLPIPAEPEEAEEFDPIARAQSVIDAMPKRPRTFHRGNRACYSPLDDQVTLPEPEQFVSREEYYATAYHEYVHSTGHASRTGRVTDWTTFGSDPYAKEELVAEMGAAFLSAVANIDVAPLRTNSEAYIASWIRRFEQDPKLLVQAASQAQKAADFILGVTFDNGEEKA